MGIMQSLLTLVRRESQARSVSRIDRIVVRIGALSGVEPEALRFAFDAVAPAELGPAARLDIETIPATARCRACRATFTADRYGILVCPDCGEFSADILTGRELELARMEYVETRDKGAKGRRDQGTNGPKDEDS